MNANMKVTQAYVDQLHARIAELEQHQPDYQSVNSVRTLEKMKDQALEEYHAKCQAADSRIQELREKRGTKIVQPDYSDWADAVDPGRNRPRRNGNW